MRPNLLQLPVWVSIRAGIGKEVIQRETLAIMSLLEEEKSIFEGLRDANHPVDHQVRGVRGELQRVLRLLDLLLLIVFLNLLCELIIQ